MSRSNRALKKARTGRQGPGRPVSKLGGPPDVIAMIPYLFGFQPVESLVVVALEGPRKRFGPLLRIDLAADPDGTDTAVAELRAEQVVAITVQHAVSRVLVAAFSRSHQRADPVVQRVLSGLVASGVAIEDAFRADGTRWWSYTCRNPMCCSPDGAVYDVGTSRVAAEAVLSGLTFEPDRDALRALFAPEPADQRDAIRIEVDRLRGAGQAVSSGVADPQLLRERVSRALDDPAEESPADIAWLALAVQSDVAMTAVVGMVDRSRAAAHFELWRAVLRCVDDELLPAIGCLAAFAAWLDGRGVFASHALDRVFEVAPQHSVARHIEGLLTCAVNPKTWDGSSDPMDGDEPTIGGRTVG